MKCDNEESFLNYLFKDLHISKEVLITSLKSDNPNTKIAKYLSRLDNVIKKVKLNNRNREISKVFFYNKYLCDKLPERYIDINKSNLGRELSEDEKNNLLEIVRTSQKESLDVWLDFLIDSEYPIWFKYYLIRGVLKSGSYDKEIDKITKRTKTSAFPFLEFNQGIVEKMFNYLSSLMKVEFDENIVGSLNFQKLYVKFLKEGKSIDDEGIWVKYPRHSSADKLVSDIIGYNTGWCINQKEIASNYISYGNFYIYYSKDKNNEFKVPRIAIRTFGDSIQEIRGIIDNQNLERSMFKILNDKLEEFPYIGNSRKALEDFQRLSLIEDKMNNNEELSNEELCFLYEIGDTIESFGYSADRRINEIRNKRNMVDDLNKIFREVDCSEMCLFLDYIKDAAGIDFPSKFYELNLSGLENLENLKLSDDIKGSLVLNGVKTLSNYHFPRSIVGTLEMENLEDASNVKFPEIIENNLNLFALKTFNNVSFPKEIYGTFEMPKVQYIENFIVPKCGGVSFRELNTAKNVIFPETMMKDVNLSFLKRAENLVLPDTIYGSLNLQSLVSAKGIIFPKGYVKELEMKLIKDFDSFTLPSEVGRLLLPNLTFKDVEELISNVDINELFVEKYYTKKELEQYFSSKSLSKC